MRACIAFKVKDISEIQDKDINVGDKKIKLNTNGTALNNCQINKNGNSKIKTKN
jgi:hypothetical protein